MWVLGIGVEGADLNPKKLELFAWVREERAVSVSMEPAVHRAASVGPVLGRVCQVWICEEERPPTPPEPHGCKGALS